MPPRPIQSWAASSLQSDSKDRFSGTEEFPGGRQG